MTSELLDLIKEEVAAGYIRAVTEDNLTIYNYTPQTQWSKRWNDATKMCRGLILDPDGNIVARPFPKFFNWGETPELWDRIQEEVEVTPKYDGSLGIVYPHPSGEIRVATRGSFTSEQALWATEHLKQIRPGWHPDTGTTHLVEIVYPKNRIVVDYGDRTELIDLAVLDNTTGKTLEGGLFGKREILFGVVAYYKADEMRPMQLGENGEGEVVRFLSDDVRVKFKYSDYVRLHKLVTGTNARNIWEHLSRGDSLEYILDKVPDEFYKWAKGIVDDLRSKYADLKEASLTTFENFKDVPSRKRFAELATQTTIPDILFAMLDNKPYDQLIWKRFKPAADRPFRTDEI